MNALALLVSVALATTGPAGSAEEYGQRADQQYADGFFGEASASYATAYELDPDPVYLYGWAQAERRAGNCPRAVELYREYAALDVSDAAREAARKNALRCGGSLDTVEQEPVEEQPVEEEPVEEETPEIGPVEPAGGEVVDTPGKDGGVEPWMRDTPAISLLTTGGAIGLVAVVLGVGSASERRKATEAEVEVDYARHIDRSTRLRTGAIVCGVLGGAAIIGGAVRYFIVARRARPRVSASGAGLSIRF